MAFDQLSDRLQMALRRIRGKGRLTEDDIDEMMREVRLSLLEADVNFRVVKTFTREVKEKAKGERILKGLNPSQQVVKVVHEELQKLLGGETSVFEPPSQKPMRIMLAGLQGSGKTTTAGKLAKFLQKEHGLKPMLVALDLQRPAAIEQLQTIGRQLDVPVYQEGTQASFASIIDNAAAAAESESADALIFDTAGRLHIDEDLMEELKRVKEMLEPEETWLVLDAMTGQDAVSVADHFHGSLGLTGSILTKLDSDTRGGAALSLRHVTGVPIKFMGLGEKLDALEVFHPERMAGRILGMGDVMTLVDKVSENVDEDDMMKMVEKMASGKFNFDDYLKQLRMVKRMGSLSGLMKLIPGMNKMVKQANVDDGQIEQVETLIHSMTKQERKKPELLKKSSSRRRRVARGSGRRVNDVNRLLQTFDQQKQAMKQMSNMDPSQIDPSNPMGALKGATAKKKPKKGKGKGKGKRKGGVPF